MDASFPHSVSQRKNVEAPSADLWTELHHRSIDPVAQLTVADLPQSCITGAFREVVYARPAR